MVGNSFLMMENSSPIDGKHFHNATFPPYSLPSSFSSHVHHLPSIFIFLLSNFLSEKPNKGKLIFNCVFPWIMFIMENNFPVQIVFCPTPTKQNLRY